MGYLPYLIKNLILGIKLWASSLDFFARIYIVGHGILDGQGSQRCAMLFRFRQPANGA